MKLVLAAALGTLVTFGSCKKTANDLQFSKSYGDFSFVVDTATAVGPRFLAAATYTTDIEDQLSEKGFLLGNLKKVKIKNMTISTTNSAQNLNYFRRIDVRVSNGSAGELIFGEINLPDTTYQTSAVFNPSDVNLVEVFRQKKVEFRFYGETDLPILPDPVELKSTISFDIEARLGN